MLHVAYSYRAYADRSHQRRPRKVKASQGVCGWLHARISQTARNETQIGRRQILRRQSGTNYPSTNFKIHARSIIHNFVQFPAFSPRLADRRRLECLQLHRLPDRSQLPGVREHQERDGGETVRHLRRVQVAQEQLQGGRLRQGRRQLSQEEAGARYVIMIFISNPG